MEKKFHYPNFNYIDDFIHTGLPADIYTSHCTLNALLQELVWKLASPSLLNLQPLLFALVFEIDTVNKTLHIPDDKLKQIQDILFFYACKTTVTKSQFQSLLGSFLYITRFFLKLYAFTFKTAYGSRSYYS